jgi:O-antigen ligase
MPPRLWVIGTGYCLLAICILTYFAGYYFVNTLMEQNRTTSFSWNKNARDLLAILCCIGMIAGLMFSRALLSISMFLMFLNALHPAGIRQNVRAWKKSTFAVLSFAFFLAYLISGFWSKNLEFWQAAVTNKLPFAVLPFAFLAAPLYKVKYQRLLIGSVAVMQLLVVVYSLVQLGLHADYYLEGYHVSRPLPTTRYGDHIRFSLSLVLSLVMICYLLFEKKETPLPTGLKVLLGFCLAIFVLYVHILAAKTGLLCLYLAALLYVVYRARKRSTLLAFVLALVVVALPFLAYNIIPTFKTKIDYVFYEIQKSKQDKRYDYTLSDAGRMITYDIGSKAIAQHPVVGVGAGDVMDVMREGYKKYYPEVAADQQYGPINQFMFSALCVGIPLTLLLVFMSFCPLFAGLNNRVYLNITVWIMLVSIMVESMLEVQFGVFTYLFFLMFWMSALRKDKVAMT